MDIDTDILITDLYELSMLQAYFDSDMSGEAVFEFFVRKLPPGRGYLVACGLEWVLKYLQDARFSERSLSWMRESGRFSGALVDHLRSFRFGGDVHALAEGSVFFPGEPILRVTAPIAQAQLVETRLINLLQFPILAATKAARCVHAAFGKQLVDFGLRRAHGAEAGLMAAYASYLAGFAGTSNVAAGAAFGIPVFGTMAHSFIEAHDSEIDAFIHFARSQPANVTLLIDTYDTETAARRLTKLAPQFARENITLHAVRLDSGNLAEHAFNVRDIFNAGGLGHVKIFASGGIDEYYLEKLTNRGAPIDGYGVGSKLNTSADAPYLDCAYKLVEYAGKARRKQSEKKATLPGRKQVYRRFDRNGRMCGDILALEGEYATGEIPGEPLLQCVMNRGKRVVSEKTPAQIREHHAQQMRKLPPDLRRLDAQPSYSVSISKGLDELSATIDREILRRAGDEAMVV